MPTIIGGTTGVAPSQWTTAGRPSSPLNGQLGWNTTLNVLEVYNGINWQTVASQDYAVTYLILSGGGGGGGGSGGGGGAGGLLTGTANVTSGTA